MGSKKYKEARASFEQALTYGLSNPADVVMTRMGIGHTFWVEGNVNDARTAYEAVLAVTGTEPAHISEAHLKVGECFLALDDKSEAKAAFFKAMNVEGAPDRYTNPARDQYEKLSSLPR